MVSRSLSVLVALIPAVAFANAVADENPEIPQAELETWSDEQLCRARDIPEALDELERREIFDGRELRAIRRDRVRERIGEEALRCMKGSPETVLPAIATFKGDVVDAFVYPPGTFSSLIVYIRRENDVSSVVTFTEGAEPYQMVSTASVMTGFCSDGPAMAMRRPRGNACFSGTTAYGQHRQMVQAQTPTPSIFPPAPQTLPSQ